MVSDDQDLTGTAKTIAWVFLLGLLLVAGAARGVYSSQGVLPSARFELLTRIGLLTFFWYWVRAQCNPYRAAFPLDVGLFIAGAWFLVLPHYLWRYERWRGLLKCAALAGAAVLEYLVSVIVHYILGGLST